MDAYHQILADPTTEVRYEIRVRHHDGVVPLGRGDHPQLPRRPRHPGARLELPRRRRAQERPRRRSSSARTGSGRWCRTASTWSSSSTRTSTPTYVSPSFTQLAGIPEEDVLGHNAMEFIHPDDRDDAAMDLVRLFERPAVRPPPGSGTQRGRWRVAVDRAVVREPPRQPPRGGDRLQPAATSPSATRPRRALRRSEERFKALVGGIRRPAIEVTFGRPPAATGHGTRGRPPRRPRGRRVAAPPTSTARVYQLPCGSSTANGSWHHVEVSLVDLSDNDAINGVVAHIRDVTGSSRRKRPCGPAAVPLAGAVVAHRHLPAADASARSLRGKDHRHHAAARIRARRLVHPDDLAGLDAVDLDAGGGPTVRRVPDRPPRRRRPVGRASAPTR